MVYPEVRKPYALKEMSGLLVTPDNCQLYSPNPRFS
jgi:hypothetical protein